MRRILVDWSILWSLKLMKSLLTWKQNDFAAKGELENKRGQ